MLLLRHEASGVDFDVSFAWTAFEHEAIAAATVAVFGTVKAPMALPEDLIVFKAIAGRGKDIDDMTALLVLYPKLDLARVRARVRELAVLADAPEMPDGLERTIAAAKDALSANKPLTPTPKRGTAKPARKPKRSTAKPPRRLRATVKRASSGQR